MMAVVCFDLIPEALELSPIAYVIGGVLIGIGIMIYCDLLVQRKFNVKKLDKKNNNSLLKTGIIVSIGLAIHNIPEGLAIGSGFEASVKLGLGLAIAICLHDIPERYKHVCSNEKWWDENMENSYLCCFIWHSNRSWSFYRSNSWFDILKSNINLFKFCCRGNALYSITENYCQKLINYIVAE